ncbi:GDP-mannose-dependent alpha-(1-6)-phosphatidylinositol monomannoside mannosyltransferase [Abditibacteriota bacterium]|nr:GDP-mannose-dependent alpha-(1-6)-phosphatidylinositol monomannoside mannosyltransferase [Abditibacteriota bacterium]
MRVAIVHDFLMQMGGAEKVVEVFHDLFPDAPIYTSAYDPSAMPASYRSWDVRTSFLQKLPAKRLTHRGALLLYPTAFESFDLSSYDLVLSSSSAFSKGVITQPHTTHICYTHSPMRYAWATNSYVEKERIFSPLRSLLAPGLHYLRTWDAIASMRVDRYIANSSAVARRIRKFYRREAEVVHPPVDTNRFQMAPRDEIGDYGIVASRLVPYKRVDLAVRAFTKLKRPLKVVGTGRQLESLKAIAGPTIEFLGYVSDAELPGLVARARMYLMPGEEDFGIAPVEANAAGVPVVAFAAGGALDVQVEGKSGLLFRSQTVDELCDAVERAYAYDWDPNVIRENAMRFDTPNFRAKIQHVIATTSPGDRREEGGDRRRNPQGAPRAGDRRRAVVQHGRVVWFDRRRHILSPDGKTVIGERTIDLSVPSDIVPVEAPTRLVVPDSMIAAPEIPTPTPAPEEKQGGSEASSPQLRSDATVQIHDASPPTESAATVPALHSVTRNGHYTNGHVRRPPSGANGDHNNYNAAFDEDFH